MTPHPDGGAGKMLEHLHGVLVDELRVPIPQWSEKNPLAVDIHNDLDTLASTHPDFVESFIAETRRFVKTARVRKVTVAEAQRRFRDKLKEFLERVGPEADSDEVDVISFYGDSSDDEHGDSDGTEDRVKKEQTIVVLSDDDLESLSPDSPTATRFRVKSEPVSAANGNEDDEDAGEGDNEDEDEDEDGGEDGYDAEMDEDADDHNGQDEEDKGAGPPRPSPAPSSDGSSASSSGSYSTARSHASPMSPRKRKVVEEDSADTPARRRLLEAIKQGMSGAKRYNSLNEIDDYSSANGVNGFSILNGVSSTPKTPTKRQRGHTGATEWIDRLQVRTSPQPQKPPLLTPISLSPAPTAPSLTASSGSVSKEWNPQQPLRAPPNSEAFVEILPKNSYQKRLNDIVNFYVQWELERHVQDTKAVSWDDFTFDDFEAMAGSASDIIPRIPSFVRWVHERKNGMERSGQLKGDAYLVPAPPLCTEMDMEETSIVKGDLRGLGNDDPQWSYGGKLVFCVSVEPGRTRPMRLGSVNGNGAAEDDNPFNTTVEWPFSFKLRQIEQPGKSTRLARRYGSRRILSIRFGQIPQHARRRLFHMLVGRGLVLFGRVFRMIWIQPDSDSGVAVETNEQPPGSPALQPPLMPSILQLLQGYNYLEAKPGQAMAKWSSRLQLLLSDSIPGVRVSPDAIQVADDIVCMSAKDPKNPATAEILTDGCGLMSQSLAQRIRQQPAFNHLARRPYSIQMRIGGSKGLLTIMNSAQEALYPGKDIVLRHSMVKSFPADSAFKHDPSLFTLDILRVDSMKVGSSLSGEPLIVMTHNGVPPEVLLRMAQGSLEELKYMFQPYRHDNETEQDCMRRRLIAATYRFGGVSGDRNRRFTAAEGKSAKVTGLVTGFFNDDNEKSEEMSAAEKLYEMLLAGFKPTVHTDGCVFAATKLRMLVRGLMTKLVSDLKIKVDQSASAFIVPDTLGILAPDEIYVSFASEEPVDPRTGTTIPILQGDCLVFRYPCKLPTDVRKFKAVNKPELSHLRDCIVLSANSELCTASPASFLAGGDYDGDVATVIWDQDLVQPFTNAPDELAQPPADFDSNFVKQVTSVREVLDACGGDEAMLVTNVQHFLLGSLLDEHLTGIYSTLHDNSVYTRGCGHPETMRLAHMFCAVLDARKSGLSVPKEIQQADRRNNAGDVPWRMIKKGKDDVQENVHYARRPPELGMFIMDELLHVLKSKQNEVLAAFPDPKVVAVAAEADYSGFMEPYEQLEATRRNCRLSVHDEKFGQQINTLCQHVQYCMKLLNYIYTAAGETTPVADLYRRLWEGQGLPQARRTSHGKSQNALNANINERVLELMVVWREGLPPAQVPLLVNLGQDDVLAQLKVSYAVHLCRKSRKPVKLPFELDLATMCDMKARMSGKTRTYPADIAARFKPAFSYNPAPRA